MPQYFFHLECYEERIIDKRGQILPDEDAALREAKEIAAALRKFRGETWWVMVTNEGGTRSHSSPDSGKGECLARPTWRGETRLNGTTLVKGSPVWNTSSQPPDIASNVAR